MLYTNIQPLSTQNHKNLSICIDGTYGFSRHLESSPILISEFSEASKYYCIVFVKNENNIIPIVLLGNNLGLNLFLNSDNTWGEQYIPAYIRRYPFIFSKKAESNTLTLCVDMDYQGCNTEGKGELLFGLDGNLSEFMNNTLDFLKNFQSQNNVTEIFTEKLDSLGLLMQMAAEVKFVDGKSSNLGGFLVVDRNKLKQLSPDTLKELVSSNEMELIYQHLNSLQNIKNLFTEKHVETSQTTKSISKKKTKTSNRKTPSKRSESQIAKKASAKKASAKKAPAKKASAKKASAKKASAKKTGRKTTKKKKVN